MTKQFLKNSFYAFAKFTGLFKWCESRSESGLRILCYHGVWKECNPCFSDILFMDPEAFERRMAYLAKSKYVVLPLNEAIDRLYNNSLPANTAAITVDDGWYCTYEQMLPVFERYKLPATIYLASYYAHKDVPITQILLRYLLAKSPSMEIDIGQLTSNSSEIIVLTDQITRGSVADRLNTYAGTLDFNSRHGFCREVAAVLQLDYESITADRSMNLMNAEQIKSTIKRGFDIQLHTHRHRIQHQGHSTLEQEIDENREFLNPLVSARLEHFCYPSGIYSETNWKELEKKQIKSATTCKNGINYSSTHKFGLTRLLDATSISTLEFEAEMCGFGDLVRSFKRRLRPITP